MCFRRIAALFDPKPWYLAGGVPAGACVAAFRARGASDYAASKINLANPGYYDCVDGAAYPSWDSVNGWTFASASSQYLQVGSGAILSSFPMSIVALFKTSTNAVQTIFALSRAASEVNLWLNLYNSGARNVAIRNGSTVAVTTNLYTSGAWSTGQGVANSSVLRSAYVNGSGRITTTTSLAWPTVDLTHIGAYKAAAMANFFNGNIGAIAVYNFALTDDMVSALSNAMNAL